MTSHLPINLVVLISGSGSNLQAIIDNINSGELSARISMVISDQPEALGLIRAKRAGIPTSVVVPNDYQNLSDFFSALMQRIESQRPDLVVLAGFMRILPDRLVTRFEGKMMNIHPSLLPKYKGLDTHRRVLEAGDRQHGATVHFVTAELDEGPVIIQATIDVDATDNIESLRERVLQQEHRIYSQAIQWFAERRITIDKAGTLITDEQ